MGSRQRQPLTPLHTTAYIFHHDRQITTTSPKSKIHWQRCQCLLFDHSSTWNHFQVRSSTDYTSSLLQPLLSSGECYHILVCYNPARRPGDVRADIESSQDLRDGYAIHHLPTTGHRSGNVGSAWKQAVSRSLTIRKGKAKLRAGRETTLYPSSNASTSSRQPQIPASLKPTLSPILSRHHYD